MITPKLLNKFCDGASNEYYPQEIADALLMHSGLALTDKERTAFREDLENALYDLMAIAQNEYNHDFWRVFWNILQLWTANNET